MSDPFLDDVFFLSNWDGTNNDTTYTPEIGTDDIAFFDNAELTNTLTMFGNTVAYVDGDNDYIDHGSNGDYSFIHLNDEDFTLEFFFRVPDLTTRGYVLTTRAGNNYGLIFNVDTDGAWTLNIYDNVAARVEMAGSASDVLINTWYYFSLTRSGGALGPGSYEVMLDAVSKDTDIYGTIETGAGDGKLTFGKSASGSTTRQIECYYGPIRVTKGVARTITTVPIAPFPDVAAFDVYISDTGPLQQPSIVAFNDFSALVEDTRQFYEMEITGTPVLLLPISSWQATLQSDQANYAQCVIPNVTEFIDEIIVRQDVEEFIIYKTTEIDGKKIRSVMVVAPVQTVNFAQGAFNSTATMSGYTDPIPASPSPKTRIMTGIRTDNTSGTGKRRVRCDIDWFLRPGDTATVLGDDLIVVFINYFVPTAGDAYMDIGDR